MGDVIWTGVATEVVLQAGVAVLTLNRPPVNALSHAFRADIAAALHAVTTSGAKGLVLTGAGETFVAGAEISELGQVQRGGVEGRHDSRSGGTRAAPHRGMRSGARRG